jgi:hypothetical protein
MESPKVWFKLMNPESNWTRVSLENVEYVDDLKKTIKKEASPFLDNYFSAQLILKAEYESTIIELNERDKLFEVLNKFNISAGSSIKESFAEKINLFVYTPEGSYLPIKIYIHSNILFFLIPLIYFHLF